MKITVIGAAGWVGMSAAFQIAATRLADEMVLIDVRENLVEHHAMDLSTAVSALDVKVKAGGYEDTVGTDVVVNAGGLHGDITADRTEMLINNTRLVRDTALQLRRYCPEAVVITAVNPVDALNYAIWLTGGFERRQLVGYSLNDTLRFREFAARAKGVEVSRVEALAIGEHGFTQVPLFSSVRIDGQPVSFSEEEKQGIRDAYRAFFERLEGLKAGRTTGWTCAIGLAALTRAVVNDTGEILAGSAILEGEYGQQGISMGVPIRLGKTGIQEILEWDLAPDEQAAFERSAEQLKKNARIVEETLAMTQRLEKILEPGMIGPVKTRNRMLKTANGTSFMEADQTVGPRMIAWYERLAKGGVGFLVVESSGVEYPLGIHHVHYLPDGTYDAVQLHFEDDRLIPGFQRLTEAVHKQGCPISIQLLHSGPWDPTGRLPRDPKIRDVKCASAMTQEELPGPDFLPCRAMTKQEIEDQVDLWAAAAERAFRAGFDAAEINHGTCHQGNTFLSRIWNKRDDEYGPQSYENRTRFLRDIVTEAKRRCGPTFAVHVLMNAAEYNHPLATTLDEGAEMAKLVATVADGINLRSERYGHRGGLQQPDRILYPEPPVRPARRSRLEPEGQGSHGAAGGSGQAQRGDHPAVDRLPARPGHGRGVSAEGQSGLRGHDPSPARRPGSPQQGDEKGVWRTSAPAPGACTASIAATRTSCWNAG